MSKYTVQAGWDDCPHLDDAAKAELLASIPAYQRDARSKGTPSLGSGAIYPVEESELIVPAMELAPHWRRGYGLDVGWNRTGVIWGAEDRDTDTIYLYAEHYGGRMDAAENARHVKAKGEWIRGVIDPAARGRSQTDGEQLLQNYRDQGLDVEPADNSVEAGLDLVWMRMVSGRLKVFKHLVHWLSEFRKYRRDAQGRVVKSNDHLMDATRYLVTSGRERMLSPQRVKSAFGRKDSGGVFAG